MVSTSGTNWFGYTVVLGSTLINIPVAGFMHSFGVFVQRFEQVFCAPEKCLLLLGWISALPFAINLIFCLLVMRIQNKFGDQWPFIIGICVSSFSLLISSYIQNLHQLMASYCIIYGLSSSLVMYIPLAVIEHHFPPQHPRHVLCTSIVTVGAPIGIMVMNPLAAYLDRVETADWRDTFKIFGVMIALFGILPAIIMKRPSSAIRLAGYDDMDDVTKESTNEETGNVISHQMKAVGRALYPTSVIWCLAIFLIAYAIFIPKTHFINYMVSLGIDTEKASLAIGYSGITEAIATFTVSILGTLVYKKLLWFYIVGAIILAISNFMLIFAKEYMQLVVYSLVHGVMDGCLMTLTYPVLDKIARDPDDKPVLFGMTQLSIGLGQLVGLPLTGLMYDVTKSYTTTFILCSGTFSSASGLIMVMYLVIYLYRKRQKQKRRDELKEELMEDEAPIADISSDIETVK